MRSFLRDNEQLKISLLDKHSVSYNSLCWLFCFSGNANEALNVEELGRARALADLMSARYSVKQEISVKPQEWLGTERVMKQEINCNCLYISYCTRHMFCGSSKRTNRYFTDEQTLINVLSAEDWKEQWRKFLVKNPP